MQAVNAVCSAPAAQKGKRLSRTKIRLNSFAVQDVLHDDWSFCQQVLHQLLRMWAS